MGQYYQPLLIDEGNGKKYTACSHEFDNGLKLMEHSWVGNNFMNVILNMLASHPMRVAWLGDYSDTDCEKYSFGNGFVEGKKFMHHYNSVWLDEKDDGEFAGAAVEIKNEGQDEYLFDMEHTDCFLVNLTKGCYIDLEEYVKENKTRSTWDGSMWCINPLSLLTCVGNGRGGGDYRGINDADVGAWAFDEIYISALRPAELKKVMYQFREE